MEKSAGGTGSDGIKWAPLQVATVLARLRRAGHIKAHRVGGGSSQGGGQGGKKIKPVKIPGGVPLRKKQRVIHQVTAKAAGAKGDKGKETRRQNILLFRALKAAGASFHDAKTGREVSATRGIKKGHFLTVKDAKNLKATVNVSGYMIGVDKGLQRASGSPGKKGKVEGGVFVVDVENMAITVGYGMSYSKYFDEKRKLIPDVIPEDWLREMEKLVAGVMEVKLSNILKEERLS
jgi:hypothetical protein